MCACTYPIDFTVVVPTGGPTVVGGVGMGIGAGLLGAAIVTGSSVCACVCPSLVCAFTIAPVPVGVRPFVCSHYRPLRFSILLHVCVRQRMLSFVQRSCSGTITITTAGSMVVDSEAVVSAIITTTTATSKHQVNNPGVWE